jgi:hypothetical protein
MMPIAVLTKGEIPKRKSISYTIYDELWIIWTRCLDNDPNNRPSAADVLDSMAGMKPLPNCWLSATNQALKELEENNDTSLGVYAEITVTINKQKGF